MGFSRSCYALKSDAYVPSTNATSEHGEPHNAFLRAASEPRAYPDGKCSLTFKIEPSTINLRRMDEMLKLRVRICRVTLSHKVQVKCSSCIE
jgi:hypothetical protein